MDVLIHKDDNEHQLGADEQKRVDDLFGAARRFHYLAFLCAGLSLLLSMLEKSGKFILPFGGVDIPSTQASVALYLTAVVLVAGADRFAMIALYWSALDSRRPPFAWLALGIQRQHHLLLKFWLALPLLGCSVGTAAVLENDPEGVVLAFCGVFAAFLPRVMASYMHHIVGRTDERGGRATFSIYLLYWLRFFRQLFLTVAFFLPVLAVIPPWRVSAKQYAVYSMIAGIGVYAIRLVGAFVYKAIDRLGGRMGFPTRSEHY